MNALQSYQQAMMQSGYPPDDWERINSLLENSPIKTVVRSAITWTDSDGSKSTVCSDYHTNDREARKEVLRMARKWGWTYPRWWQWWRWDDTRPSLDFSG